MQAALDTCFLIDWAYYRERETLKQLFDKLIIIEKVLNEVKSERTLTLISKWLSEDFLYIIPITNQIEKTAESITRMVTVNSTLPRVEEPEIYGLAIAKIYNVPLLSENKGALRLTYLLPELEGVKVLRALDILSMLIKRRILKAQTKNDVKKIFEDYCKDTKHLFPVKDLNATLNKLYRLNVD